MVERRNLVRPVWSKSSLSHCFWVAQGHLFTKHLLFCIFPWSPFLPFEVLDSYPLLLSSGCHIYLSLPHCLWNFMSAWIPHMYKIKFDFLLVICLMSIWLWVWLEGPWRGVEILPLQQAYDSDWPVTLSCLPGCWDCFRGKHVTTGVTVRVFPNTSTWAIEKRIFPLLNSRYKDRISLGLLRAFVGMWSDSAWKLNQKRRQK